MFQELSFKLLNNYTQNIFNIKFKKNPILKPLFFTHYLTLKCNFNCSYCGFDRNNKKFENHNELNTKLIFST